MMAAPRGIVLYDAHHYFEHDDRFTKAAFFNAATEYAKEHDEVEVFVTEEFTFGNGLDFSYMRNSRYLWTSKDGDKPAWCIYRGGNWRHAKFVEDIGIECFPSSDIIRMADDKAVANSLAASAGIALPETVYSYGWDDPDLDQKFPCVVKACGGYAGDGVYRAGSGYALENAIGHMPENFLVQRAVETGDDLRVLLIGREIDAVVQRSSGESDFRSNRALGGKREVVEASGEVKEVVAKLVDVLPGNIGHISCDFLTGEKTLLFCEINATPGSFDAYGGDATGVVERYIEYIEDTLRLKEEM